MEPSCFSPRLVPPGSCGHHPPTPPSLPPARQMLPNSDLIRCLRPHYPSIAHRVACIYTPSDNILLKAASALLLQVRGPSFPLPSLSPSLPP
jgi:hypothetical protein